MALDQDWDGVNKYNDRLSAIHKAVAAERERCAAIADRFKTETETPFARGQHSAAFNIALAIRVPDQRKWAEAADAERTRRQRKE